MLYARLLGNLVGNQYAVSSAILLTFLLGIGFGTLFAHRLWRFLWLLEAFVGVCGLAFAMGTHVLDGWLFAAWPVLGSGIGTSILVCCVLLSLPAFAIGTSLPLFAGYLSRLSPGRVFARAYALYNFGAALTVLLIEFALLRAWGLSRAVMLVATINLGVAAILRLRYMRLALEGPPPAEPMRYPTRMLAALALASAASAIFQLLMLKIAECILGPFRETFALVLAITFAGLALGSWLVGRMRLSFTTLMTVALAGLLWLLGTLHLLVRLYASAHEPVVSAYAPLASLYHLALMGLLMGAPALAFGGTIPALLTVQTHVARDSGRLLFVSSMANGAGFLAMALALHRLLDYGTILLVVGVLAAGAAVLCPAAPPRRAWIAGALLLAAFGAQRTVWDEPLLYIGHTSFDNPDELRAQRERLTLPETFKGHQDVFSIARKNGDAWFFINGYMSIRLNSPSERLVGAFSSVFAPRNDRALVLGLGSGATAGTVGLLFDRTDAVEISPVILDNLHRMAEYNFDFENIPGVRIVQDDGIHFVKASDETYSLIVNTVTTPLYFSASKLYTREFLESVRRRMTPDGVYVTWMDRRVGDRGAEIILRTVGSAFPHCWLGAIKSTYYLLVCSREPLAVRQPEIVAQQPRLAAFFHGEYSIPPRWIPFGLLSTRPLDAVAGSTAPLNTLDYPALEFEMARLGGRRGYEGFVRKLVDTMSLEDMERALAGVPEWDPSHLVLYSELLLGESGPALLWRKQIGESDPGFERRYAAGRIRYLAGLAAAQDSPEAQAAYGEALAREGRVREALEPLSRALELDPQGAGRNLAVGIALELLGRLEPAIAHFTREIEIAPRSWLPRHRRGLVYARMRRYRDALDEMDAALALEPRAEVHVDRARVLEALERREDAIEAYRDALRVDPGNERARAALERLAP